MTTLDKIRDRVDQLYRFRDEYFTCHSIEDAKKKSNDVNEEIKNTIQFITEIQGEILPDQKGLLHFYRGKALNASDEYNATAEHELATATKFNLADAWNELGECQFKKTDYGGAQMCFEKALALAQNKVYLRNMSTLLRSLPWKTSEQRIQNVQKGVEYARQALQVDMSDGQSWLILGNAYLTEFFTLTTADGLKNCRAAYIRAAQDPIVNLQSELHFNRFQPEWYEENYSMALQCLQRALELEPTWDKVRVLLSESREYLGKLSALVSTRGKLSQRKLASMVTDINPSQLGTVNNDAKKASLVPLALLAEGTNEDKVILGKVVGTIIPTSGIPFSFCLIDNENTCVGVSVYNWGAGYGVKIGDSVAIISPMLRHHHIDTFEEFPAIDLLCVRVSLPIQLVVNKRPINKSQIAVSRIVCEWKTT